MGRLYIVATVVSIGLCVYSLIDIVGRQEHEIRHLPKLGWILLVLFFPFVGSVAWLVAGRTPRTPPTRLQSAYPEYDRPGRATGLSEESDEEFLNRVRERAERQREQHRRRQREEQAAQEAAREEARRRRRESRGSDPGEDAGEDAGAEGQDAP